MQAIGKNYENSLDQVNQPGKGPDGSDGYFIPGPTGTMDCATLQTYKDKLENQILYWYSILQTGNNSSAERENLNKIIAVQTGKKNLYNEYMLRTCTVIPETTPVPETLPTDQPTFDPGQIYPTPDAGGGGTEEKTNWLLIAGVGVGALLILKKKKRGGATKKKVSGIKSEDLLLIGIGGFLVYKLVSKNSGTSSSSSSAAKKQQLISWMNGGPDTSASKAEFEQILNTMSAHEIDVTYNWVFYRISAADTEAIFEKYQIFG